MENANSRSPGLGIVNAKKFKPKKKTPPTQQSCELGRDLLCLPFVTVGDYLMCTAALDMYKHGLTERHP